MVVSHERQQRAERLVALREDKVRSAKRFVLDKNLLIMNYRMTRPTLQQLYKPLSVGLRLFLVVIAVCSIVSPPYITPDVSAQNAQPQLVSQSLSPYLPTFVPEKTKRTENVLASCGYLLLAPDTFCPEVTNETNSELSIEPCTSLTPKLIYTQTTSSRL